MSKRAHLHDLARKLRRYLSWQKGTGSGHYVPATEEERASFEAKKKAIEEQQLDDLRSQIGLDSDSDADSEANAKKAKSGQSVSGDGSPNKGTSTDESTAKSGGDGDEKSAPMPSFDASGDAESEQKTKKPSKNADGEDVSSTSPLWKKHDAIHEIDEQKKKERAAKQKENKSTNAEPSGPPKRPGPPQQSGGPGPSAPPQRPGPPQQSGPPTSPGSPQRPTSGGDRQGTSKQDSDSPKTATEKMEFLEEYLGDCTRCPLHKGRSNVVFGDGDPTASLMFVGEGPGREEDRQGLPFVGPSGQLLTKMIGAMGLSREEVYITNVVKCRPPQNRNPAPLEIKECAPFLKKQIQVIEPQVIVTVGKFASNTLLDKDEALGRLRGKWHEHMGIAVMPTYHPAYLLRNEDTPKFKRRAWNDLKMVMKRLGLD